MNYLAHAYLSFHHSGILIGNMTSDFIKGNKQYDLPADIQVGIRLHRLIDEFTDSHKVTSEAKQLFREDYRLYSGAFIDIVYDHFLAKDETRLPDATLKAFAQEVYTSLEERQEVLPERFKRMLPFMKEQNWLYHYNSTWGIANSFAGLVRRAKYITESNTAFNIFKLHYEQLKGYYEEFIPEVESLSRNYIAAHL